MARIELSEQPTDPRIRHLRVWCISVAAIVLVAVVAYFVFGWRVRVGAADRVALARKMLAEGHHAAARDSLGWLLRFEPTHDEALLLAARCHQFEGDLAKATDLLGRIPSDSIWHKTAGVERFMALLQDDQLQAAEIAMHAHLARYPDSEEANDELRWLYFNQFRSREIERLIQQQLKRLPGRFSVLRHSLLTEFRKPVPREGVGYLESVERHRRGQLGVARALGYCYWQLGNLEKSKVFIDAAWRADPTNIETRIIAAEILIERNQLDAAADLLSVASSSTNSNLPESAAASDGGRAGGDIDVFPDDRVYWLLSQIAERRGQHEQAMSLLSQAMKLRPLELKYVHRHGMLLRRAGRHDESAARLRLANQLESCQTRLTEIVLSGAPDRPTAKLCRELAELCEVRGRQLEARGWRSIAQRLTAGATVQSLVPAYKN